MNVMDRRFVMDTARHSFRDHVGELELEIEAPSLAELYAEAGRALARIMAGDDDSALADRDAETIEVRGSDPEALLAEWLNELIFLSETRHRAYTYLRVESVGPHALTASVRGVPVEHVHTAVKAATLHGIRIEKTDLGYRASVVLDV